MKKNINNGKGRPEERVAHAARFGSKKNTATKSGKIGNNFQNRRFCALEIEISLSNTQQNEFPTQWTIDKEISRINSLNVGELVREVNLLCELSPQNPLSRIYFDRLKEIGAAAWEYLQVKWSKA